MNIFNLIATLSLSTSEYDKGINDAKKKNNSLEKNNASNNKKMIKSWIKVIAIIAALVAVIVKATKATLDYTETISDNSKKLGISEKDYQDWAAIVKGAGGSTSDFDSAMQSMNDTLSKASEGSSEANAKLAELGLTYDDFAGKSPEEAFDLIVTSLQNMEDGTDKTRIAQDLFGADIANSLMPILSSNSDSVESLKAMYESMGMVMSDDTTNSANELSAAFGGIDTQFKVLGAEILSEFAPSLKIIADWLSNTLNWMIDHKEASMGIIAGIVAGITAITVAFGILAANPVVAVITAIIGALVALGIGIAELIKHWDELEAYFEQQWQTGWLSWLRIAIENVKGWFLGLGDTFTQFGRDVSNFFTNLWEGIKSGFKSFCNFFIDGMNGLISGLNKISFTLPDWMGGAHFGIDIPLIPRLQKGEDFVPNDFYPAYLDYGERVLTRKENEKYSALGGVDGMETLVNGIGGAVSGKSSVRSSGDVKVYVQIGEKDFKSYVYEVVDASMRQKGYKSLRKVGSYD